MPPAMIFNHLASLSLKRRSLVLNQSLSGTVTSLGWSTGFGNGLTIFEG